MQIEQTILPSGLVVITHPSERFESASMAAFVNAGSRQEVQQNNGAAHFLEHLMFKGTTSRTARDIATQIEVLGSDINAFTESSVTAYHTSGLASNIDQSIDIIGDMLSNSQFLAKDIALESGVILQEVSRSEDSPNSVMYNALQAVSYPNQSLGRTILGSPDFITNATTDDFRSFVDAHYTANNIVIAGAGGIDHESFVKKIEIAFAGLPQHSMKSEIEPARYVGGVVTDRNRDFKQVALAIAFESVSLLDESKYHHILLADAFGGAMSSPLFTEIREKRGLVYSTGCYTNMGADNGRFILTGGMTAGNVEEFIAVSCQELRKMCDGIDETDLLRAKNTYLVSLATLREKPYSTACFMARSYLQRGYVRSLSEMRDEIASVTLDDLKTAARRILATTPSIAMIGPGPDIDYAELVRAAIV